MKKATIVEITALIAACNGLVRQLDAHHFGATMFLGIVALAALALIAQRTVSPSRQASPLSRTSNEQRASRAARRSSKPAGRQPRQ